MSGRTWSCWCPEHSAALILLLHIPLLQEWNIGRRDLERLVSEGLLSAEELQQCIVSEFNPVRVGFVGMSQPIHVSGVLNLGVQPR